MVLNKCKHIWLDKQPDCLAMSLISIWMDQSINERSRILATVLTQWPEGYVHGNLFPALFESTFRVSFKDISDAMRLKYPTNLKSK